MAEILEAWAEGRKDECSYLNPFASQCKGVSNDKDFQKLLQKSPSFVMCEERRDDSLEMLVVFMPLKSAPSPLSIKAGFWMVPLVML